MSRTRDLIIANDALYQLSYRPTLEAGDRGRQLRADGSPLQSASSALKGHKDPPRDS